MVINRKGTAGGGASNPGSPESKTAAAGTSLGFFRLTQATSFREVVRLFRQSAETAGYAGDR
ncbi:MAG: hypothetical protein H6559_34165 [Lewinellaceae bacterium]|nr:hypothetical protein [Lewinellaceae bacterium]